MNLLKTGPIANIFLWSIIFEPLICKSDFNLIFLLQSMTAIAKQNPKENSLQRCCHNRFFRSKEWNIRMSTHWFLVLKNLVENRIIWNRNPAIFIPNCKWGCGQPFLSATRLLRNWIWNVFILYPVGKGAFWVLSAFGAFPFPEGPLKLPFDILVSST